VSRGRLRRLAAALALLALACAGAGAIAGGAVAGSSGHGATIVYKDLVLHAEAAFQPERLPRSARAPIRFEGKLDLSSRSGAQPAALTEATIFFDRDGRLDVAGLPTCAASQVATLGSAAARQACAGAIVGKGTVEAEVAGAQLVAPLTIFNGPPEAGHPTAILHAPFGAPADQIFAIPVPIERIPGPYGYRVTLRVPPLAAGLGSLTRIQVALGREYRAAGVRRSYISARCSNNLLHVRGRFAFAEGTVVDGNLEKYCRNS
jgi:hypothetical protein